jgi:hypothetical protein
MNILLDKSEFLYCRARIPVQQHNQILTNIPKVIRGNNVNAMATVASTSGENMAFPVKETI